MTDQRDDSRRHSGCGAACGGSGLKSVDGTGLPPLPSVETLVRNALAHVDQRASARDAEDGGDKCCGCGGCDKKKS